MQVRLPLGGGNLSLLLTHYQCYYHIINNNCYRRTKVNIQWKGWENKKHVEEKTHTWFPFIRINKFPYHRDIYLAKFHI